MKTYYVAGIPYSDELYHHGIKGQRWGFRRFQYEDGSLTQAGRNRYLLDNSFGGGLSTINKLGIAAAKVQRVHNALKDSGAYDGMKKLKNVAENFKKKETDKRQGNDKAIARKQTFDKISTQNAKVKQNSVKQTIDRDSIKKYAKIGAATVGAGLLAYGMYKLSKIGDQREMVEITDPKSPVKLAPVIQIVGHVGKNDNNLPKYLRKYVIN